MQDISGKSENHAGLITVAIGLVKLWSTKYEIQQHLWQRFIFTKTSQSGSTTNRIGAERYPLAETFSPCTVARDSNASQVTKWKKIKMADGGCFSNGRWACSWMILWR